MPFDFLFIVTTHFLNFQNLYKDLLYLFHFIDCPDDGYSLVWKLKNEEIRSDTTIIYYKKNAIDIDRRRGFSKTIT